LKRRIHPLKRHDKDLIMSINIGKIIHDELVDQGRTVTWLSKQLGTSRMSCYRIFDSYSIDTQLLGRISNLLGVDFFKIYSENLDSKEN